jgi:Ankyrin repeats (3 copies)
MITKLVEIFLFLMSMAGLYVLYLGIGPVIQTIQFLRQNPQTTKGTFDGYDIITTYSTSSASDRRNSVSHEYFPKFSYKDEKGKLHRVKSYQQHLYQIYDKGDEVDVLIPQRTDNFNQPRIGGFLSLFSNDGLYVVVGLFMLVVGFMFIFYFPWADSSSAADPGLNPDKLFGVLWDLVNENINLRWLPGLFKNIALLAFAIVVAYVLAIWKPWQIPARTALYEAAEKGEIAPVKDYIESGYDLDYPNDYDQTALNLAVEYQHWEIARMLLNAGARTDIESKMHRYPIEWAVYHNDTETALLILEKGSPVNDLLMEPLARAYLNQNLVIMEALMKAGADLQKIYVQEKNLTFGDIAKLKNDQEVLQLVKKYGGRFTH